MPPVSTSVPDPVIPTKIPDVGIPVLAPVPTHSAVAKTETHHRTTTPHAAASPSVQAAASTVAANFSRGYNSMPHPPYPEEAVNLNWTGTVIVLVEFDEKGDVVSTTISKSSGIPLLDTSTCSFIRTNWHSMKFAGLSIPQPVEYKLY
jgi:TonB family protein